MAGGDFIDFYRRHYASVRRYACRYGNLDPDELAQVTLVRAYMNWSAFDSDKPWAWLKKVLDNAAIDELRRQHHARVDMDSMSLLPTRQEDPADAAVRAERHQLLHELIHALPRQQRALLQRKFFDEVSYDVLSAEFGISNDTARQRVHRALERLTELAKKRHWADVALPVALGGLLGSLRRVWTSAPTGLATGAGVVVFAVGYGAGIFGSQPGSNPDMTMPPSVATASSAPSAVHSEPATERSAVSLAPATTTRPPISGPAVASAQRDHAPKLRSPMTVSVDVPPPDTGPGRKQSHDIRIPTPAGDVTTDNEAYTSGPMLYPACGSRVGLCG